MPSCRIIRTVRATLTQMPQQKLKDSTGKRELLLEQTLPGAPGSRREAAPARLRCCKSPSSQDGGGEGAHGPSPQEQVQE